MNTNTNELRDTSKFSLEEFEKLSPEFVSVPEEHQKEATKRLHGKKSVHVPFNSSTPLARYAKQIRQNQADAKKRRSK